MLTKGYKRSRICGNTVGKKCLHTWAQKLWSILKLQSICSDNPISTWLIRIREALIWHLHTTTPWRMAPHFIGWFQIMSDNIPGAALPNVSMILVKSSARKSNSYSVWFIHYKTQFWDLIHSSLATSFTGNFLSETAVESSYERYTGVIVLECNIHNFADGSKNYNYAHVPLLLEPPRL